MVYHGRCIRLDYDESMDAMARRCRSALVVLLAAWLGALLMVGASAALAFPIMKRLDPTLPGMQGMDEHWKIAAGSLFFPLFEIAAVGGLGAAVVAALLAIAGRRALAPSWRALMPIAAMVIAIVAAVVALIQMDMGSNWRVMRAAIKAADWPRAAEARVRFNDRHPAARLALMGHALALAGGLAAAMLTPRAGPEERA